MKLATVVVLAACSAPPQARTVAPATPPKLAVLAESFTLDSKILGEQRVVNVYTPPDYAKGRDRFPVLYMPDGGMDEDFPHVVGSVDVSIKNGVIRPLIVVGVKNTERRRDLPGPTSVEQERKAAPHAGGNGKFRAFLRDELKPAIEARYRATTESALIGESLAGLFVIETFVREPTLFDGYIAADPSLWWNEQELVRSANPPLMNWTAGPKQLYFATSDEADEQATDLFVHTLQIASPSGVTWRFESMPTEHHATIFPTAALHGIRMLFEAP